MVFWGIHPHSLDFPMYTTQPIMKKWMHVRIQEPKGGVYTGVPRTFSFVVLSD